MDKRSLILNFILFSFYSLIILLVHSYSRLGIATALFILLNVVFIHTSLQNMLHKFIFRKHFFLFNKMQQLLEKLNDDLIKQSVFRRLFQLPLKTSIDMMLISMISLVSSIPPVLRVVLKGLHRLIDQYLPMFPHVAISTNLAVKTDCYAHCRCLIISPLMWL